MSQELPSLDEFVKSEDSKLPTLTEFMDKHDPENFTYPQALGNVALETAKATFIPGHSPVNEPLNDAQRIFATKQPFWNIVKAFGHGYGEQFSVETDENIEATHKAFVKDYLDTQAPVGKAMVDGFVLPAAKAMWTIFASALYSGVQEALYQSGKEVGGEKLGRDLAAMPDAFMAELPALPHGVAKAKANGILEGEGVWSGTKEPTPEMRKSMDEASILSHEPPPPTVHEVARNISPETFAEYDELSAQRDTIGRQLREAAASRKDEALASAPHNEAIAELQTKLEAANPRMAKKYQEKLETLTAENDAYISGKTQELSPEINRLRGLYTAADYRMRDLAPKVSKAYRDAEARQPIKEETAPVEQAVQEPLPEPVLSSQEPAAPARSAEEMRAAIMEDVKKDLVEAGRPEDEAAAASQLIAAYYETKAERFGGKLGTAEEIYAKTAPEIKKGQTRAVAVKAREFAQKAKGKIRLAKDESLAQITLFKTADASTFIHETGHHWLDDLMKDAEHEAAPSGLIKDAETVRSWLGVKKDEAIPTRAHEKFARGFERYIMEGVAPTKGLAKVFAEFRDWLTRIYQTVARLKSPITEDIRDVFDRFLTTTPERTVIAPENAASRMMAGIHEADAIHTEPPVAAPVRNAVEGEITETAVTRGEGGIDVSGRSGGGPSPAAGGIPQEAPGNTGAAGETGPVASGQGVLPEPGAVAKGGGNIVGEGADVAAKPEGAKSPAEPLAKPESELVDKAGNIRLENLTDNEDVRSVMRQVAEQNDNFMNARRGVVSDQEVIDLANAMGVSARELNLDKLRDISVNDDIPLAVRIKVGRQMLVQSSEAARNAMQKVVDTKGSDEALMELADARRSHLMIAETIAGVTAEWGRAGRAFKDISKEQLGQAEAVTELFQKMTGMSMEEMRAMAKNPAAFDTAQKAAKLLQDSTKPTFGKMLLEYRQAAMLSNPLTHVKNIVSNAAMSVTSVVETAVAAGVGKALGAKDRVYIGEAKERLFAIRRGTIEGWASAKDIMKDERAITGNRTVENIHMHAIPGAAGQVIRIPLRALSAEDEIFKGIAFRQEINALAYRTATKEGLAGDAFNQRIAEIVQNPTEEMMGLAKKNADYQTLTQSLVGTSKKAQDLINSNIILKNIVPFFRTNVNSLKYFVRDRSPMGLLFKEVRENLSGKNGTIVRDNQIARLTVGTSVISLVSSLASQGLITGGGPRDPNERALMMATGWRPYSVKIGDGYYSYEWLQGFSTPIGMTADVVDVVNRGVESEDDMQKILAASTAVLSKRLMDISSLSGVSDTVKALDNPETFGAQWIQNYLGSYVPGLMGQVARVTDPDVRDLRGNLLNSAIARIPGWRETLPAKRDVWGQKIENQGNLGPDIISPIYQSRINNDPVNQRLMAIGYFPSKPDRKIRGVELTEQQYDDYVKVSGRLAKQRLNILVAQTGFSFLPDAMQIRAASTIVNNSREQARRLVMMQNPDIVRQAMENKLRQLRPH